MNEPSEKNIKEKLKEELLPRSQKYLEMIKNKEVPETTQTRVVIPCLVKTLGFKTNQYKINQSILKNVVTDKQFNAFIRKANNIIEDELITKSQKQNSPFFSKISLLLKISIAIAALAFILLGTIVYANIDSSISDIIQIITIVLLSSTGIIASFCPIILYNSKYTSLNHEAEIKERLKQLEGGENKYLQAKNTTDYHWKIQHSFYWIELHINRTVISKEFASRKAIIIRNQVKEGSQHFD